MAKLQILTGGVGIRGLALMLGVLGTGFAEAQPGDPFAAGTRWTRDASNLSAWMAEEVHFAGRDQFVWGQAGGGLAHNALLRSDSELALVDREETLLSGASLVRRSAAGERADRVYSLLQVDTGTQGLRQTEVHGYAPFDTVSGADMPALWTHAMGTPSLGEPYLQTDRTGNVVVAALWLSDQDAVQVDVLDGTTGALLSSSIWPGLALNGVQVSADGTRIAIAGGLDFYVVNTLGQTLYYEALSSTVSGLAISADGSFVAASGVAGTTLLGAYPGGYSQVRWIPSHSQASVAQQTISVEVALSDDGQTLAVAQWSYLGAQETAMELWNTNSGTRLFRTVQPGGLSGQQNLPTGVRLTPDGKRAAFSTWGNGVDPEVLLVDRNSATVVHAFDLPGSAFALDLDLTGTRIAVAYKLSHAQTFHSQGAFALLDSGERGLQALTAARPGQELRIAAGHAEASIVLLLLGQPAQGVQIAGVSGMLLLGRSRVAVRAALAGPDGSAQFTIDVPANWASPELPFAIQAAFRLPTGTALTEGILEPICLH